ncbi:MULTISPECIES: PH domain-containing protein [unclassified Wenzhouxiangella]|uniref:PH domain-containing protein n=1 Tax=unclassified Wenzhouxiangella TaxID=2613841 RepID=UPI000E3282B9|nr:MULTISPECIES: PH domain-containing protein [unclassified Wenzhouxiangella]RFF28948.1 PH domain-containing protein [Wenzhouxiangella sp. 15181]RFP68343.1 PH domain-containing protein [Wenzhouxiangella sp. 15190]
MTNRSPVLREASIKPEVIRYQMWGTAILVTCTVVAIPLLPLILPIVYYFTKRYYARLEIVLTRRDLKVRRGIWNVEEKSVPLEKITDLALNQGPIMRLFDIKGMKVETAGQSSEGALVTIVGIDGVDEFRDAVLDQRDRVSDWQEEDEDAARPQAGAREEATAGSLEVLGEIRDSLKRIEQNLAGRAD